jgi:SH3 domain-containing protein
MKHQNIYRSNWAMPIALLIIFAIIGCTGPATVPTSPPAASSAPAPSSTSPVASPSPETGESMPMPTSMSMSMPTSQPLPKKDVLYQDDFTDASSGWPDKKTFDNYFFGYHEPQWYFIQITSPNSKAPVIAVPKGKSYPEQDATIELQVFTDSANTAPTGDFRYGLVFRRSGDQYYAFTISPRTKKWYVLKSSPNALVTLKDGVEESIQGLDNMADLLRVDAMGSNFFFYINGNRVGQASDSDYANGEIGLYAESFDSTQTRIHFDALTIRDLKLDLMCSINGGTVYVRSGPGKAFAQIAVLSDGDTVEALGISSNRWIKIKVEGSDAPGWVSYSEGYMSCTPTVDLFPVVSP